MLAVRCCCAALPLDGKCLLMRETNLRNCPYIYGIVVYTGNDTKIQMVTLHLLPVSSHLHSCNIT
jgi:hypothetical protein